MSKHFLFLLTALSSVAFATAGGDPRFPGGANGTVGDDGPLAFSHPIPGANRDLTRQFFVGNSFFKDVWVGAPSSTEARDGLGPTFNANSCAACHGLDGRGAGFNLDGSLSVSLLFRLSAVGEDGRVGPDPVYGDQLNPFGVGRVTGEGSASVAFTEIGGRYADGTAYTLRRPDYDLSGLSFGPFRGLFSPRVANQLVGLGLLEAIPAEVILAGADPSDADGDGISGKAQRAWDIRAKAFRLGRFGWKAGQPSLRQQGAAALLGDVGVTTSLFPSQNCPPSQRECERAVPGGEPEATDQILDRLAVYTQLLAVPARRDPDSPVTKEGEQIFHRLRCQSCHRPSYETAGHELSTLNGQFIFPYTDLLLHDMGEALADGRPEGEASGREWRTPPLWGLGLIPRVNRHQNLLHDGRARGVAEAILWHDGEARDSREAFRQLNFGEREALVQFVNSL